MNMTDVNFTVKVVNAGHKTDKQTQANQSKCQEGDRQWVELKAEN